jgi:ABC-type transporter Mla subunit MlaD
LANNRLEEIENFVKKEKTELVNETLGRFNEQMTKINQQIETAKSKGKNLDEVKKLIEENKERHEAVLDKLESQVPDDVKDAVAIVKDAAQQGYQVAKDRIITIIEREL